MASVRKTDKRIEDEALVETPDLEEFIGYNLKRAYVIVQSDFRRTLGEDGFAPRVFSALSLVVQYPNVTSSGLARMLGIERSGLVAIVDELEGRGLLKRTNVPGDRRVQALVPTAKGKTAYAEARAAVRAHEDRLLSNLSDDEKATLMSLLGKIRATEA
ncbi:MarR family transcriptional regulator [Marivita sp. XM-24bin2]|jgi:DNA-binding MarR family transcriptional regulator|uniref:MarR family winged helix-turn-helix transcriptional regulator n=1 Tax=unclassified Marivita TaxID=2632480 RepID=UPI000D7A7008|nr:MarR family transcriptional regulator [Marivita sp. XM-24bin2]MCR9108925.1 MarR family transcriptional regulator [Paracoccaceae bacterium]PWL36766.1 MAG: MarR family transcriptional regulator [Marivita sp. XM-24bin2]